MILFVVFVVQFSVSCACLALNKDQQVCLFCPSWCSFNTFYRSNQVVCFFLYRTSCWRSDGTNPRTLKKTWRKHSTAVASLTSTTTARVPLWVKSTERFFFFFSPSWEQWAYDLHDHFSPSRWIVSFTSSSSRGASMTPPHSHATRARTSSSSTRARCSGSSGGSDSSSALQRSVNVRVTKLMRFGVKNGCWLGY